MFACSFDSRATCTHSRLWEHSHLDVLTNIRFFSFHANMKEFTDAPCQRGMLATGTLSLLLDDQHEGSAGPFSTIT